MLKFVKIKIKTEAGPKMYWAQKTGDGRYREVNKDGEWGYKGKVHYIVTSPEDLIWEKPARMDTKYGTLTLETTMIKLKDLISEAPAETPTKRTFMYSYQTHNGKYSVKANRLGVGLGNAVELVITDNENGTEKTIPFQNAGQAKAYWKKLHQANLKSRDENLQEDRYDGADELWTYKSPSGNLSVTAYQMDSKMGGEVEVVIDNKRIRKQTVKHMHDKQYADAFYKALVRRERN